MMVPAPALPQTYVPAQVCPPVHSTRYTEFCFAQQRAGLGQARWNTPAQAAAPARLEAAAHRGQEELCTLEGSAIAAEFTNT